MDMNVWYDMFYPGIPIIEKILRPVFVYAFLIVGFRLAGKRELAQLNAFDLVVLLTLSNTVQNAIIGDDVSVSGGIIGATTLFLANAAVVRFLYRHQKLDRLAEGEATVLIARGEVQTKCLERELITRTELETEAHKHGFDSLDRVERAVLEVGGTIWFTPRQPTRDAMRHDEIIARIDDIARQLAELRRQQGPLREA